MQKRSMQHEVLTLHLGALQLPGLVQLTAEREVVATSEFPMLFSVVERWRGSSS
jgi:hypothetical protein